MRSRGKKKIPKFKLLSSWTPHCTDTSTVSLVLVIDFQKSACFTKCISALSKGVPKKGKIKTFAIRRLNHFSRSYFHCIFFLLLLNSTYMKRILLLVKSPQLSPNLMQNMCCSQGIIQNGLKEEKIFEKT